MSDRNSPAILPEPPPELKRLSQRLGERIRTAISTDGPMPFSRFMEMALYEPGLGYYSAGLHKFGPGGDFITAPGLGRVFAACLANQVAEVADQLGDYTILEIGAGDGSLAADLLQGPDARLPDCYQILERSADLRAVQRATLERRAPELLERVQWLDQPPGHAWQGILLANEVVDALPVEIFRLSRGARQRMHVIADGDGFGWLPVDAEAAFDASLQKTLAGLPAELPEGYCSELNPHLDAWLLGVAGSLQRGCAIFVDYGYPRREYYLPERSRGTLICHYRQRAHADPFWWPGLQDISAWVDFTALAEAGLAAGLECAGYTSQAMFLIGCGLAEWLENLAERPAGERLRLANEIRQLTLPGAMGEKFQVMALARGLDGPLRGFSQLDLSHRL
jgi:SAM-dependent MidA family methyltransferase